MKNQLLFLFLFFLVMTGFSQNLVITEINYNDPSGGNNGDTLEYIELLNTGTQAVDISGYQFTAGITYTFPLGSVINSQQYIIITKDTAIFRAFYGLPGALYGWNAGQALSNNGEAVVLKDSTGLLQDSVRYYTASPWPATVSGTGPSMMLCDPALDNNVGSNWIAASPQNAIIFEIVNNITVFGTPFQGCVITPPYVPVSATFPYMQSFDSIWFNGNSFHDVPDNHFLNTPASGNTSWRKNDEGSTAGWSASTYGAYTPTGAVATASSARFHTAGSASGSAGTLDLFIDLSTAGEKMMNFWYINTDGTDSLCVYFSQDSGLTFSFLQKYLNTTSWEKKTILLGNVNAQNSIIRFHTTSNLGTTDIGLDEVAISFVPADDAGVLTISNPSTTLTNLTDTIKVVIRNYGTDTLTNVQIGWSVDGIVQTPVDITDTIQALSNSGEIVLGPFTFTANTASTIKAWTSLPNGNPDPEPVNDTSSKSVFYQAYAAFPFLEGFDSAWIDRFSTHDVPTEYWRNEPATGNNSWRRADDGSSAAWSNVTTGAYTPAGADGTANSARFHTGGSTGGAKGVLELYINLNTPGDKELRFWHINTAGQDSLAVWVSTDGGNNFTFLAKWSVQATWAERIIPLGNMISPLTVFRFRTTANAGGNTDVGLDQVSVGFVQPDVAVAKIVSPVSGCNLSANTNIIVRIKNAGNSVIDSIPLNTNAGFFIIPDTLQPGDSVDFVAGTITIAPAANQLIFASVNYPGDANNVNDSLAIDVKSFMPIDSFPFLESFETGNTSFFSIQNGINSSANIISGVGADASTGLMITGLVGGAWPGGSSSTTTYTQAFGYADHITNVSTSCLVDATTLTAPELKIDLRQEYSSGWAYNYFRVLVNDTIVLTDMGNSFYFNATTQSNDIYKTHIFDLVQFAGTTFKLTLQGANRYNAASAPSGNGDETYIDNILIRQKPAIDPALTEIISPTSDCGLTNEVVEITVCNYGADTLFNIPVYFTVNGASPVNEIITDTLTSGQCMTYAFNTPASITLFGSYTIETGVNYPGDLDTTNNIQTISVINTPIVTSFPYFQDFEGTDNGWTSASITGINEWVVGTPVKPTINTSHSGMNVWTTGLSSNYSDNTNTYVLSPCFDLTSLAFPVVSVWLYLKTELNYDAMILEASANGGNWQKVTGTGFYNNNSNQGNLPAPKWSGDNGGWTKYTATINQLGGISKVQFRFRFVSDNMDNDEGVAIDDFSIFPASPDLTVTTVNTPQNGCELTATENVQVNIRNVGQTPSYGMILRYTVDYQTYVYDTITDTLNNGPTELLTHTFSVPANLSASGVHYIIAGVFNSADYFHDNDSVEVMLFNTMPINNPPVVADFETPDYIQMLGFVDYSNSRISVPNGVGVNGGHAVVHTGGANGTWPNGTGNNTTLSQAYNYSDHTSEIYTCDVSISSAHTWAVTLDLKQTFNEGPNHSWFRLMLNGTEYLHELSSGDSVFNPVTAASDEFVTRYFLLDPSLSPFRLSAQVSCKNDDSHATTGTGDKVIIDNLGIVIVDCVNDHGEFGMMSFPNPANDQLNIQFAGDVMKAVLELRSVTGQILLSKPVENSQFEQINLENLPAGVYSVSVRNDYTVNTLKFVKQ